MKIIATRIVALSFFLHVIMPPAMAAEQLSLPAPDIEPPTIQFEKSGSEIEAGEKTFTAVVTDNVGAAEVTLYFKGASDISYTPKRMKRSSPDSNTYTTSLYLDPVIIDKLEIYVRADDVSGNSVFEGQKFSPFAFTVVAKDEEEVVRSVTEPAVAEGEEEGMSTLTMILIGLGVAALAGGGGGGGGGGTDTDTGSVTITTDVPN